MSVPRALAGRVCVVAGATRGAGRGIAQMLGEAGATVYCSGRSVRGAPSSIGRPETIEETAELVGEAGGTGIPVRTDHADPAAVAALFARVAAESGRLDVLVNDIGGEDLADWAPFAEADTARGFAFLDTAVRTHILTARHAVPMMVAAGSGLIVEITDGDHAGYRGSVFYDLAKNQVIRLAFALSRELRDTGVTALAVTPGFLRSEAMLERFGVTEANWRDAAARVQGFEASETPCFVGRAIAALAADPDVAARGGRVFASWTLARDYGFTDVDGGRPDWGLYLESHTTAILDRGGPATEDERFFVDMVYLQLRDDPRWRPLMARIEAGRASA